MQAGDYKLSGPYTHDNLTIYLIHGEDQLQGKTLLTLEEALEQKKVVVHETQQVNELAIENTSDEDVFVQSGDIIKGGRGWIGGIALPIHSVALSALRMGQPTAFSNTANLLRICACKDCDHRYSNDRSAQKRLDRYDLSHCVAPERLQDSKWSGSSVLCRLIKTF